MIKRPKRVIRIAMAISIAAIGISAQGVAPQKAFASCAVNVAGTCVVPGTDGTVPVPTTDTIGVATSQVCPIPVAGAPTCTYLYELVVDAHNVFAQPMAPAGAASSSSSTSASAASTVSGCNYPYNDPSTNPYQEVTWGIKVWNGGTSWNDSSNNWRLEFQGYSDYDDCGVVDVNWENTCNAWVGYSCVMPPPHGGFFDRTRDADTAWLNQDFTYNDFIGTGSSNEAQVRVWTTPEGHVTFGSYYQCTGNC